MIASIYYEIAAQRFSSDRRLCGSSEIHPLAMPIGIRYDRNMMNLIHFYYGNGKGKTTASIGLAVRAAGAGFRVLFCQFLKGNPTAELSMLSSIPGLTIHRPGKQYPFTKSMTEKDRLDIRAEHDRILSEVETVLRENSCRDEIHPLLVILDEAAKAWTEDLLNRERLLTLLDERQAEFVLTGRDPVPEFLQRADYLTELTARRHPYERTIPARKGIEF